MAYDPKPLVLVPEADSTAGAPQPVSIDGLNEQIATLASAAFSLLLTEIDGYDAGEEQTLTNNNGTLEWTTNA